MKPEAKAAFDKWAIGVFNDVSDPSFEVIGVIAGDAWSEAWDTATALALACATKDAEAKIALLFKKQLMQEPMQVVSANHVLPLLTPLAVTITNKKACCISCNGSCLAGFGLNPRFSLSRFRPRLAATQEFELVI